MSPLTRPQPTVPVQASVDQDAYRNGFMSGAWETEVESAAAFDEVVPEELFTIHREVRGTFIAPRPAQVESRKDGGLLPRIDRVLVPTEHLLNLGWGHGIIGCELKRSGEKIGPAIAQAMDYSRAVWTLEPSKFRVWLDWIFIWPMPKQSGPMASICAQNRIGSVTGDERHGTFQLKSGETSLLVAGSGDVRIGRVSCGARSGSR